MNDAPRYALLALIMYPAISIAAPPPNAPPAPPENRAPADGAPKAPPAGAATPSASDDALPARLESETAPQKAAASSLIDKLSDADLSQIVSLIRSNYVSGDKLSDTEIKRSTVEGLLQRLKRGVRLLPPSDPASEEPSPFRSEILDGQLGYIRLGAVTGDTPHRLDAALKSFADKRLPAIALDLRATSTAASFDSAAEICRRFAPAGKLLFTVRRSHEKDQIYTSNAATPRATLLVVLTGRETSGDGEIIASVLQSSARAMLIGSATRGETAEFKDLPLASGERLRVAVAEAILPGGAALADEGIKPDLVIEVPEEASKLALRRELEKGAAPLVDETERAKLNEAALVAGTNPELDATIAAQTSHEKPKQPLHDAVLQRALDFVTTIGIYEKNKQRLGE